MIATASSSIAARVAYGGQRPPTMCSLRFSPVPRPRKKRPGISSATVAAAWAMTAGWYRTVGHVTPVPTAIRAVAWAIAPSMLHTNGLLP
jgi:hypothetical protein